MASFFNSFFSRWGSGLNEKKGKQNATPSTALVSDTSNIGPDGAMQISAVWACLERRSTTVASLPLFVYE